MRRIDSVELMQRAKEIYGDLGQWLLNKTEADIERRYGQLGERYAKLGISESHWVWSIVLGRQQLWRFLESEAFPEGAFEVFSELELVQTLDHFFDRLVYHGIAGFDAARLIFWLRVTPKPPVAAPGAVRGGEFARQATPSQLTRA